MLDMGGQCSEPGDRKFSWGWSEFKMTLKRPAAMIVSSRGSTVAVHTSLKSQRGSVYPCIQGRQRLSSHGQRRHEPSDMDNRTYTDIYFCNPTGRFASVRTPAVPGSTVWARSGASGSTLQPSSRRGRLSRAAGAGPAGALRRRFTASSAGRQLYEGADHERDCRPARQESHPGGLCFCYGSASF